MTDHAARSLIAAIDQGTTSSRVILFDRGGRTVASHQLEHGQITPRPGWVEHDPDEIIERVRTCIRVALRDAGTDARSLAAVGISNQRETTVVWDRRTGRPVHPAIVWQDTRTAGAVAAIGEIDRFRARTGLPVSTYSSALKLQWILDNVPGARAGGERGELLFGTIDTYLTWHLTGGADHGVHVTDVSNASRTMLMDLETLDWDPGILEELHIPRAMLPEVRGSSEVYGTGGFDLDGVPIAGMLGDQQAALFGQACFEAGQAKCTYGTGVFMLMHTGTVPVHSRHGLITTVAARLGGPGTPVTYALEGSVAVAGSLIQWLRDQLGIIEDAAEIEIARPFRAGFGGRGVRARVLRPVRPALAARRPRRDRRPHPVLDQGAHRPGGARSHGLPGAGARGGHGGRSRGATPRGAAGGRRDDPE